MPAATWLKKITPVENLSFLVFGKRPGDKKPRAGKGIERRSDIIT